VIGKIFNLSKATIGCIILACGLGNTSFFGYPFLTYFYGADSIRYAIFVDQPGSFFVMSTFGVLIAVLFSSGNFNLKEIAIKLFSFPPFVVFLISLFLPPMFVVGKTLDVLNFIGSFMVPLAMLSLGLQFKLKLSEIEWESFFAGLAYKLLLAPLIIYVLFYLILKKQGEIYAVSVLECAMPPMITSSIIASEYGLDEKLAGILPTLGILLSIPTLAFWYWMLN
jgi:predicted permease